MIEEIKNNPVDCAVYVIHNLRTDKKFSYKSIEESKKYINEYIKYFEEVDYTKISDLELGAINNAKSALSRAKNFLDAYSMLEKAKSVQKDIPSIEVLNIMKSLYPFNTFDMEFPHDFRAEYETPSMDMEKELVNARKELNNTLYKRTFHYKVGQAIFWSMVGSSIALAATMDVLAIVFYDKLKESLSNTVLTNLMGGVLAGNFVIPIIVGGITYVAVGKDHDKVTIIEAIEKLLQKELNDKSFNLAEELKR